MSIVKKSIAELVGTCFLVFFGTGSAIMALLISSDLGTTGIGILGGIGEWLAIGMAFGLAIAASIYAVGAVSGAHLNPAVTIALWAVKEFETKDVIPYILAQLTGATLGSILLIGCIGASAATIGGLGATAPSAGFTYMQAMLAEIVGTFLLMITIMGVAVDKKAPNKFAGLVIGLAVAGIIITIGGISGASINPARTFGPYLMDMFYGINLWVYYPIYVIGPILGALIGAFIYKYIREE
ncbi:glycerol uptake facilitator protein [Methanococcus voltae PS]|uniref:Glycerol uptake facilitator protein n=1 Tax=Methanococcus voltae PS TaxID=523842 RepID=A0ABT2EW04_METVO|nr:MIP/aquaporin family protein [Methanococcus voltae]MCS3922141.1 glycerol uptake facilitator protein [Methanococcus voltae PS]